MFTHNHQVRVLYGHTDQMGYVYYGNYAQFYEQGRAEAIRSMGISYKQLEDSGTMMPITRMNVKYIQPAFYDELLTVKTFIPRLPNRIIIFCHEICNEKKQLINEAETHLIFISMETKRIQTAPDLLIEKLSPYY